GTIPYPSWNELRNEAREVKPVIILTVTDDTGDIVRRLTAPAGAGFHRIAWDLRYPPSNPVDISEKKTDNPFADEPTGPMVVPGTYAVSMAKRVRGETTPLGEPQSFQTVPLGTATLAAEDKQVLLAFQQKTARLQRAVLGAQKAADEAQNRINYIRQAILDAPDANKAWLNDVRDLEVRLKDLQLELSGDPVKSKHNAPTAPSIVDRVQSVVYGHWASTSPPTQTHRDAYQIAADEFKVVLGKLQTLIEVDLPKLEQKLEEAGAPYTPGRVPRWKPE
ncbi:MAG: glycosyl hydrolase, partial [Aliifodinibius sp.]|nr:glycosyl hydrolase [Fodinibius sp.]NIW43277.1 glycosyl hydrolase [Gammaproteobacteria bacterium]NIY23334.1 glycosyl hydrolase [Fodinibius sp.]